MPTCHKFRDLARTHNFSNLRVANLVDCYLSEVTNLPTTNNSQLANLRLRGHATVQLATGFVDLARVPWARLIFSLSELVSALILLWDTHPLDDITSIPRATSRASVLRPPPYCHISIKRSLGVTLSLGWCFDLLLAQEEHLEDSI